MKEYKSIVIIERPEQATRFMRDPMNHCFDLLIIDYNARTALKGYQGKIISLLDFLDTNGQRYAIEKTEEKLRAVKEDKRFVYVFRRYLEKFYWSYYFILEYIIAKIEKSYSKVYYYRDRLTYVAFEKMSPLEEILVKAKVEKSVISNIESIKSKKSYNRLIFFLGKKINQLVSTIYGKHKSILISGSGYNLLKAVRDESFGKILDISYAEHFGLRNLLSQIYLPLRSFIVPRSYKYPDARIILSPDLIPKSQLTDIITTYIEKILSIMPELTGILEKLNPSYYVSQNALGFHAMVNYTIKSLKQKCQTIMLPHGTNFHTDDKWALIEESSIAEFNADNEFDVTFIQSKLFEDYVIRHNDNGRFKYGNKLWGRNFRMGESHVRTEGKINVLYAATSTGSPGYFRLYNYLLHDEFVRDIKAVMKVLSGDVFFLHVKLRAGVASELLRDELKEYSNWGVVDEGLDFSMIMNACDALITFRSTTIEEAIYMNKPVIILDYTGRYKALPEDKETVYHISMENIYMLPEYLMNALTVKPEAFRKYRVIEEPLFGG